MEQDRVTEPVPVPVPVPARSLLEGLDLDVHHREASRRAFEDRYPDGSAGEGPRDGWYRASTHGLRAGVEAGGVIATRVSLFGAAGFQTPVGGLGLVTLPDVGRLPFFMTVGIGVALGRADHDAHQSRTLRGTPAGLPPLTEPPSDFPIHFA